jgi:hypothetical protein
MAVMKVFKIAIGVNLLPLRLENARMEHFWSRRGTKKLSTTDADVHEEHKENTIRFHYVHPCRSESHYKSPHIGIGGPYHPIKLNGFERRFRAYGRLKKRDDSEVPYLIYGFVYSVVEQPKQGIRLRNSTLRDQGQEFVSHCKQLVFLPLSPSFEPFDTNVCGDSKRSHQLNCQKSELIVSHFCFFLLLDCQSLINRAWIRSRSVTSLLISSCFPRISWRIDQMAMNPKQAAITSAYATYGPWSCRNSDAMSRTFSSRCRRSAEVRRPARYPTIPVPAAVAMTPGLRIPLQYPVGHHGAVHGLGPNQLVYNGGNRYWEWIVHHSVKSSVTLGLPVRILEGSGSPCRPFF